MTDTLAPASTSPAPRPRRWGLLALAAALGLSWFGLVALAEIASPLHEFATQWWPQASLWRLILGVLLYLVLAPLALGRWLGGTWGEWTGLRLPRERREWLFSLAVLAAVIVPAVAIPAYGGVGRMTAEWATPLLVLVALQPPIVEEVLVRGLFVQLCERGGFGRVVTTLIGALVFASWHMVAFGPVQGLITGLVSIPFFFVPRYLTGTTLVTIAVHAVANAGALNGVGMLCLLLVECAALAGWAVGRWGRRRR